MCLGVCFGGRGACRASECLFKGGGALRAPHLHAACTHRDRLSRTAYNPTHMHTTTHTIIRTPPPLNSTPAAHRSSAASCMPGLRLMCGAVESSCTPCCVAACPLMTKTSQTCSKRSRGESTTCLATSATVGGGVGVGVLGGGSVCGVGQGSTATSSFLHTMWLVVASKQLAGASGA